ncbi:Cardiolipin synthase B [Pseudomonas sp. Bi70]|nr:Cardiolipin synthase B [Pseudomonas sp. Bi70]
MPGQVYPWRQGNQFTLLNDGPAFFPRMIAWIDAARATVELEQYLVSSSACTDALLRALCEAAERGVTVRCLFDAFGCQALNAADRQRMLDAGVQLRWYNPLRWRRGVRNLYRDHRKLLVVDSQVAFVGGTGSTDDFWMPGEPESAWHEVMVEIAGPLVADWLQLFDRQWQANNSRFAWRPYLTPHRHPLPHLPAAGTGGGLRRCAPAPRHPAIADSRPQWCPASGMAGHAVFLAHLAGAPGAAQGCRAWRRRAPAAQRPAYRQPAGTLCRAALLPTAAQGGGESLRIPPTVFTFENGAGG